MCAFYLFVETTTLVAIERQKETPLRAEMLRPGLHPVRLARSGLSGAHNFRALYLQSGSAELNTGDTSEHLEAPVFLWAPWDEGDRLTVAPGSVGKHLVMGAGFLSMALRTMPNAADLSYIAERRYVVVPEPGAAATETLSNCLDGLVWESRQEAPMSINIVEAQLSILLVTLYRMLATTRSATMPGGVTPVTTRFVALIEAHLGERWGIADYCDALGVTREQLHAICIRHFDRAPGLMIRQRILVEARRLLQQSPLSIHQIALCLGFNGSPQFKRFFKGMEGVPPGRFRRQMQGLSAVEVQLQDMFAWP